MKKEIKFRAWNGNNMVDLKHTTQFAILPDLKIDGIFIPFTDEWKIMQFTGLKDKNGVDIYEGDILKTKYGNTFSHDDLVVYHLWAINNASAFDEIRVIGNIYENSELINK